jgi:hypothetical protein
MPIDVVGVLHTGATTVWSLKERFSLAKWQLELERRERLVEGRERAIGELHAKDAEVRHSGTHGIILEVDRPISAKWLGPDEIEGKFTIRFRNTWRYDVGLEKLAVTISLASITKNTELMPYVKRLDIPRFSYHGVTVQRSFQVKVNLQEQRNSGVQPDRRGITLLALELDAYLRWEGGEFDMKDAPSVPTELEPLATSGQ